MSVSDFPPSHRPPTFSLRPPKREINNTRHMAGVIVRYHRTNPEYLTHNSNQASGGVRGGTLRLLPVDSKAEATRSRLLSS